MSEYNLGRIGMNYRGEYSSDTNYTKLDVVTYNGSSFVAIEDSIGHSPDESTYWKKMAGGINDYVENESLTGQKWINGKPIYRYVKIVTVTHSGTQTKIFDLPCVPETMVRICAQMSNSGGTQWWPVPYSYYGNLNWNLNMYTNGTGVYFGAGSSYSGSRQLIVILEYTKSGT